MIGVEHVIDIRDLARQGHSTREIARLTGLARNTVRKVLRGEHDLNRQPSTRPSKLDPFKDYLRRRRAESPLSAVRLLEEIRPMGYDGSVIILRRFLASLEDAQRREQRATVRFETPPGQQAQVDWAHAGRRIEHGGRSRPIYLFSYVLGYSRALFVRFTTSMSLATLIECHQHAFDYFGGWPRVILYDNMKQVRLGPGRLNPALLDFARHHGFTPRTHRPYRPRTKGKVERSIDYIKKSFLMGHTFADLEELNARGLAWIEGTANVREHATTGRRPVDLLGAEALIPSSSVPAYRYHEPARRVVSTEAMVRYRGSRYSVPPAFTGRPVEVLASGGVIRIRVEDTIIAEHREASQRGQSVVDRDHLTALWKATDTQVHRPSPMPSVLIDASRVQRVDLRIYEEVVL